MPNLRKQRASDHDARLQVNSAAALNGAVAFAAWGPDGNGIQNAVHFSSSINTTQHGN
jgi:hypothetical protein